MELKKSAIVGGTDYQWSVGWLLIWNLRLYFVLPDCNPQGGVQSTYLPINWENSSDPHYLKNVALTNYPHYYYVEIPHTKIPSVVEFY